MNCISCKWWNEQEHCANILGRQIPNAHKDASKVGECRANPPFPTKGDGTNWRMFPSTLAKDWCGDYEAKPVSVVQQPPPAPAPVSHSSIIDDIKRRVGRPRKEA